MSARHATSMATRYAYRSEARVQRYHVPPGVEEVRSHADVRLDLPELMDQFGYVRALVFTSRTLNRTTDVVDSIAAALGNRMVGRSDEVGEHAPLGNVLRAVGRARELGADVLVSIGGGSVLDFVKFVQLALSEGVRTREDLRVLRLGGEGPGPSADPVIGHLAVPTTFATAEWTAAGTPLDEEEGTKIFLFVPGGVPRAIVYDPRVVQHTPRHLLLSTGIRGLDHAINSACSVTENEFATVLALQAITRFHDNLPRLREGHLDEAVLSECQLATWCTGLGQMSVPHGFSHYMVHLLAPWADTSHSDAACVMMLAQARWFAETDDPRPRRVAAAMGRPDDRLGVVLEDLLVRLGMPTTLRELGVDPDRLDELIEPALAHPFLTRFNLRPIEDADTLLHVLRSVSG